MFILLIIAINFNSSAEGIKVKQDFNLMPNADKCLFQLGKNYYSFENGEFGVLITYKDYGTAGNRCSVSIKIIPDETPTNKSLDGSTVANYENVILMYDPETKSFALYNTYGENLISYISQMDDGKSMLYIPKLENYLLYIK